MRIRTRGLLVWALLPLGFPLSPSHAEGQEGRAGAENQTGWEITGVPALNYDSDEGFGYGLVLSLYNYGRGGYSPYKFTLRPVIFLTTEGRRDLTLFFDGPSVLPFGWRLDGFVGVEKQIATPYYGLGNDAPFQEENAEGADPYFYRFGRERAVVRGNLQRRLGSSPVWVLLGVQLADFEIDPTPKDEGATLLLQELDPEGSAPGGQLNSLRGGVIFDSRDRESGPERGVWTSLLLERVDEALGSDASFTRWTFADRRYFPLRPGLVFAHRVVLQNVTGSAPFFALSYVQSSFGEQEALGGSGSVRGVLRNRFAGEGIFFWNAEFRWRFREIQLFGKEGHLAAVGFLDSGRVWKDGLEVSGLLSDLHHGGGMGMRLGLGPNFVVALDMAIGAEAGLQTYIGLGYLF